MRNFMLSITACMVLPMLFLAGCNELNKPELMVAPSAAVSTADFGVPDAAEQDLVEQMALHRQMYQAGIEKLIEYYSNTGDATKLAWAEKELEYVKRMPKYKYLMPGHTVEANLAASDSIIQADDLFAQAEKLYKDAGALLVMTNENKLRDALVKYNQIISKYPSSDKIDDAAYRAGRIYEHFNDYSIAVVYYQRAFKWDPATKWPARFRAAYMFDRKLKMRKEALELYKLSCQEESRYLNNLEYAKQRIAKLTESDKRASKEVKETEIEEAPMEEPMQ